MTGRGKGRLACAALVAGLAAVALPGAAAAAKGPHVRIAQNPPARTLILGGHLYPKPFGDAYIYGHVEVPITEPATDLAGQTVVLYQSAFPFTAFAPVATMTTDFEGYFSFHTTVNQNMTYRAVWQTNPPVQAKDKLLKVPLKLTLKASHKRVKQRGVVTFTGIGAPAHPGARVEVQQMDKNGRFKTFATTTTTPQSTFSLRTRVKRGGVFRALFGGDGMFGISASRPIRVTTVKKKH
jgi:hypothetical protein